jgi:two-component system sensor histidine kinase UhpB
MTVERQLERDLPLTSEEELVIYRVAQEALSNIVRHSGSRNAAVRLCLDGAGRVRVVVRDDGKGLPADFDQRSNGIRGMRERALLVGARLEFARADPYGTEIRLQLPAKEDA